LITELDQVTNTLFSLGDCYGALYSAANSFNRNVTMGKIPSLDDMYLTLNNMIMCWGEHIMGQKTIIQKSLSTFYKYTYYENESFKDIIKLRTNVGGEYVKKKKELFAKKEKFFTLGDISKWEINPKSLAPFPDRAELLKNKNVAFDIMFPKETATLNEMRDYFSYYNHETFTEITRSLGAKCQSYAKNFLTFASEQAQNLSELHVNWADIIAHFSAGSGIKKAVTIMDRATLTKSSSPGGLGFEESKMEDIE